MAFRDDRAAAHHRADALERELEEAQKGNEELRRELDEVRAEVSGKPKSRHGPAFGVAGLGLLLIGGGVVAAGIVVEVVPVVVFGLIVLMMAGPVFLLSKALVVVPPGSIAVLSGRRRTDASGRSLGWRIVTQGRVVRIPIIESVDFMDVRLVPLRIEISNVFSRGNVRLDVVLTAAVRVATHEPQVINAIERFLGRSTDEITRVAEETISGEMRGMIATLTPQELQEDQLAFADQAMVEVSRSLDKLGIEIETLAVDEVRSSD